VLYKHQHFFSDDFQLQFRAGYVSDATFLEQWFERDFDEEDPHDVMAYLKSSTTPRPTPSSSRPQPATS
jgi:hypothetical protein